MLIIPAIDIKQGKVVRLWQGNFDKSTVYSEDPVETALFWQSEGAQFLHLVDLDGALEGKPINSDLLRRISSLIKIPIQIGGGLRCKEDIADLLTAAKIERVVVGTKACEDIIWLEELIKEFREKIVVSLDSKDGFLLTAGWRNKTSIKSVEFARQLKSIGVKLLIITDIERDGTLAGLRLDYLRSILSFAKMGIILAGGIGSLEDIRALKPLEKEGLRGVIIGRALYEKRFNLKEAMEIGA